MVPPKKLNKIDLEFPRGKILVVASAAIFGKPTIVSQVGNRLIYFDKYLRRGMFDECGEKAKLFKISNAALVIASLLGNYL